VRVVHGSPGCVGKMPDWIPTASGTVPDLNENLCQLRDIGVAMAKSERVGFADVFWPMLVTDCAAREKYGTNYMITCKDGVHPGWAGQTLMAYAFLKALGCDGEIGTLSVNLRSGRMSGSTGHKILSSGNGTYEIQSSRYPFCATGKLDDDDSIRSGMRWVPFNRELNRFLLVARGGNASSYKVTWGGINKTYSADALAQGVNLADDFEVNPFSEYFQKVDEAVLAKQEFETIQIKSIFHGPEGKHMETAVKTTEAKRAPLAAAIRTAFVPVTHTLKLEPQ
jgi:hypothetical protein